jgi:nucleoside 2-deoxyribosyltransferase
MAMPYGEEEVETIVNDWFRPAVDETGFRLVRLDDAPRAGIIDNHLRVEIRRSRLLISDITHENRGAIWEAGFAEGLGMPVIYTCKKGEMGGKHFDLRNCQTVAWDPDEPRAAAEALKATIRNSLPDEAVLTDNAV